MTGMCSHAVMVRNDGSEQQLAADKSASERRASGPVWRSKWRVRQRSPARVASPSVQCSDALEKESSSSLLCAAGSACLKSSYAPYSTISLNIFSTPFQVRVFIVSAVPEQRDPNTPVYIGKCPVGLRMRSELPLPRNKAR